VAAKPPRVAVGDPSFLYKCIFSQVPFTLKELNLNKPECPSDLAERYVFDTPVVHLNDKFLLQHRVDEQRLKQVLEEFQRTGQQPKPFV
jgi:hypothetical protein